MRAGRYRWLLVGGLVLLFLGLVAVVGFVPFAQAAPARDEAAATVVDVTTTDDETTPGDGICSLREALESKIGCTGDTINLEPVVYTLTDTRPVAGDLTIVAAASMNIGVPGGGYAVIQGGPGWNDRILRVQTTIITAVVTISNVKIQGGRASDLSLAGGGIYNTGRLSLIDCQIYSNTASLGGGIFNVGTMWLTNTAVVSNMANLSLNQGGGIYNASFLSLYNSAVISNAALGVGGRGGGIYGEGTGDLTLLKNVTLSGNQATEAGGAIFGGNDTNLNYTTIYGNATGIYNSAHNAVIANSIVARNVGGDCVGNWASGGYNLTQTDCGFGQPTDGIDPNLRLGPLQNNGGPTLTHELTATSPALDKIPVGVSGCGSTVFTDQRGTMRPQGSACDIGAFELGVALYAKVYLPVVRR